MDKVIITKNGQNLLARMAVGDISAVFTKVCMSSAEYEAFELESLTELRNICQETEITNVEVRNSQEIVISADIDNHTLDTGYYITTIGVYAKALGEEEILYAVVSVSARPYMPESTGTLSGASIRLTLKVGNSVNVEITVDESTAVTLGEFNAFKRDIFSSPQIFEDYEPVGSVIPDPEEAVSQVASGKSILVLMRYIKASLKGILALSQRALNIAMGKNQARVFATVEVLDAWLAVSANVQQLNVGDNFYITATDVPDYWWDGTQKQKLETQKVDLAAYDQRIAANSSSINELNNKYNSFERAKSTIINSALGKALSMTVTTTLDTVASKISSIVNRGAWNGSIGNSGGSVTIPSGYHNGSGKVTGPTLAGLVGSNVNLDSGARMLSGYTAYGVNGTKHSGSIVNRSTTIQTVVSDTSDINKSIYWINGTNLWIIPAVGYWGSWDWYSSRIQIAASTLGVNAAKILNDTTICGVTGTVARKTSGSTAITAGGKYGFDASNGFWMYIPANAYYTTEHWLNVPYAQASALLGGTAASWTCPYMSSTTGIHAKFPSTIFSETPNRACYIIAMSFIHEDSQTGVSVSGGTQKYRWQGKVALDKSASCGYGTIIVQYVPAGTKVTVTAAPITVNSDISGDYCVVKGTI